MDGRNGLSPLHMFHHHWHPRYDAVIVQIAEGHFIFARLHFAFVCEINHKMYALALIEPMDIIQPSATASNLRIPNLDRDLALCRVRTRRKVEFIPLRLVVRGALLYPDPERAHDYIVVDVVDQDMFLRLKEIFPYRQMA